MKRIMKYEYTTVSVNLAHSSLNGIDKVCNESAEGGWRVHKILKYDTLKALILFERELPDPPK